MTPIFRLLRTEQWIKNLFVFLPLFFSGNVLDLTLFLKSVFAFVVFSLCASIVYVINDYSDIESDRKHPIKRFRPLASGAITKPKARGILFIVIALVMILLIVAFYYLDFHLLEFTGVLAFYLVMNLAYTFQLKHVAIVDVCLVSLGFVLRILAGGYATGIPISQWAILLTFILALVLALGKRRGELVNAQISGNTRKALDGYNVQFADIALSISVTLAIVSYLMFTVTPEVQQRFGSRIFYTVIFVVVALLRYLQQTLVYNRTESPTRVIYKDRFIQITVVLWILSFFVLIYFRGQLMLFSL